MDWLDEMKRNKRAAEARRLAVEERARRDKEEEERFYLKHKPKMDVKVQELEEYVDKINEAYGKLGVSKRKDGVSFSNADRGLGFYFYGETVEVCFGLEGDYEAQIPSKSGKLSMPIDKVTLDKYQPWFQWLVGWKGKRAPVWLVQVEDREALVFFKIIGVVILVLIAVIGLCILFFKYVT